MKRRSTFGAATVGAVALVAVLAGCTGMSPDPTPTPTATPESRYQPGAAGIGDPYYPLDGNGGYDVEHYDLELAYEPETGELAGRAVISGTATQDLSRFDLDLDGLMVTRVTVDDVDTEFTTETFEISAATGQPVDQEAGDEGAAPGDDDAGDDREELAQPGRTELIVTPATGIDDGSAFTVAVEYGGVPATIDDTFGYGGVVRTADGAVIVGQPRVAATWFPANDHPADKATFRIRMSVPEGLQAISNGRLVGAVTEDGRTDWEWVMEKPMATYLATATVGDFAVSTLSQDGIDYWNAVGSGLYDEVAVEATGQSYGDLADLAFARGPEITAFLTSRFGPYPFTESGGIAVNLDDLDYALENQTRPIYGPWVFEGPEGLSTVVHELAHQWFGDSLSIAAWSDIWLNESFATYAEWLWSEDEGGQTAQQIFDFLDDQPATDPFWTLEIGDPGPARVFDEAVYNRGAMTLHALRQKLGDEVFFPAVQSWAAENAYGTVSTDDFIAHMEEASGSDLGDFFDTWLFTGSKPTAG